MTYGALDTDFDGQVDASASGFSTTTIDDTDSPYTTQDEDLLVANTANGAVTVTLATADVTEGNTVRVLMIDGTNDVTVNTEGGETIDPGGEASKTTTKPGWVHQFTGDGSDWDSGVGLGDQGGNNYAAPDSAQASGGDAAAFGPGASATPGGGAAIAVGPDADAGNNQLIISNGTPDGQMVVGIDAEAGNSGMAIGRGANGDNGTNSITIGDNASSVGNDDSVIIGSNASTSNVNSILGIGEGVSVDTTKVGRIGGNSADQLIYGGNRDTISDANIKNGELTWEIDERTGSPRLYARLKDSGGTLTDGPQFSVGEDAGAFGAVYDMSVTSTPTAGDEESYTFAIDGTDILKIDAEADGSGGIQNAYANASLQGFKTVNGSGNALPGTSQDGELRVFDDTDATDPSGRIQFQANSTTFTVNADAGHWYRDHPAYAEAHDQEAQGPDETRCADCGDPFEESDVLMEVVDERRTEALAGDGDEEVQGEWDAIHTVPICLECALDREA